MLKTRGFSKKTVKKGEWGRWQKAYPEIVSSLVFIYRENNQLIEAESILSEWVSRNQVMAMRRKYWKRFAPADKK